MTIDQTAKALTDSLSGSLRVTGDIMKGVVAMQAGGSGKGGWPPAYLKQIELELEILLRLSKELDAIVRKIRQEMVKPVFKVPGPTPDPIKRRSRTRG